MPDPDFEEVVDEAAVFSETEVENPVDFVESGDFGVIIVTNRVGFGEGGFGEGPFGGVTQSTILTVESTEWTDIETP